MPNQNNFWTQKRSDGKWESKREGAKRASKVTDTQEQAWAYSREKARGSHGEALLKDSKGKIRARNTYGNDPFPPGG